MASSNHRAMTAEPVNHIFTSRQWPFVLVVWLSPLAGAQREALRFPNRDITTETHGDASEGQDVSIGEPWLIRGSRVRTGEWDRLPSFSPVARGGGL